MFVTVVVGGKDIKDNMDMGLERNERWRATKEEISRAFIDKSNLHYSCKSYKRILLPISFYFYFFI